MSYFSSHETIAIVGIVAFEILVTCYVALIDVIDKNILIVIFLIVVCKKTRT
jgi:hypothetical protein